MNTNIVFPMTFLCDTAPALCDTAPALRDTAPAFTLINSLHNIFMQNLSGFTLSTLQLQNLFLDFHQPWQDASV